MLYDKSFKTAKLLVLIEVVLLFFLTALFLEQAIVCTSLNYSFSFVGYGGTFQQNPDAAVHIPWYKIMFAFGISLTVIIAFFCRHYSDFSGFESIILTLYTVFVAYIGAKILFLLENPGNWKYALASFGGVSLFGTIFLVPFFLYPASRIMKRAWSDLTDFAVTVELNMLAVLRVGCFMNGCCASETFWFGTKPVILPVQLFESFLDVLFLRFILKIEEKGSCRGSVYYLFIGGYSCYRFLLEFIRKTPKTVAGFSNGQMFSVAGIILTLFIILKKRREGINA